MKSLSGSSQIRRYLWPLVNSTVWKIRVVRIRMRIDVYLIVSHKLVENIEISYLSPYHKVEFVK